VAVLPILMEVVERGVLVSMQALLAVLVILVEMLEQILVAVAVAVK
jgi:hypothetical protein